VATLDSVEQFTFLLGGYTGLIRMAPAIVYSTVGSSKCCATNAPAAYYLLTTKDGYIQDAYTVVSGAYTQINTVLLTVPVFDGTYLVQLISGTSDPLDLDGCVPWAPQYEWTITALTTKLQTLYEQGTTLHDYGNTKHDIARQLTETKNALAVCQCTLDETVLGLEWALAQLGLASVPDEVLAGSEECGCT
jgi:hypothetical protein